MCVLFCMFQADDDVINTIGIINEIYITNGAYFILHASFIII